MIKRVAEHFRQHRRIYDYVFSGIVGVLAARAPHQATPPVQGTRGTEMLHMAHINHFAHPCYTVPFEMLAGRKLDGAVRFIDFEKMFFPTEEFDYMNKKGITPYLILEPRLDKQPLPLRKILNGDLKINEGLEHLAFMIAVYGRPLFFTFRPQQGVSYDPELVQKAYLHVREKMEAAKANITWIQNVSLEGEIPEPVSKEDWISVMAYQTEGIPAKKLVDKLTERIKDIRGKWQNPIMVEWGSSASPREKAEFIRAVVPRMRELGVAASLFNNVSQFESSVFHNWQLSAPPAPQAYHEMFAAHNKQLQGVKDPLPPDGICDDMQKRNFRRDEYVGLVQLRDELWTLNNLVWFQGFYSLKRIKLANVYLQLARLTSQTHYLKKAEEVIKNADQISDEEFQYYPKKKYVRDYFEVLFQIAETKKALNDEIGATEIYNRIIEECNKKDIKISQQIHEYSAPGYVNRANLEIGLLYLKRGDIKEAKVLLEEAKEWAFKEANELWVTRWWRSENTTYLYVLGSNKGLLFLGSKAALGLSYIAMLEKDYDGAFELVNLVLSQDEALDEDGYMDIGLEGFLIARLVSLQSTPDRNSANEKYREKLDWHRFNKFDDLREALGCEEDEKAFVDQNGNVKSGESLWTTVQEGFVNVILNPTMRALLDKINS